jgi:hypothetical protein
MEGPMPRMKWKNQYYFIYGPSWRMGQKPLNFGSILYDSISYKIMVILLHTTTFFFGIIAIFWKIPI